MSFTQLALRRSRPCFSVVEVDGRPSRSDLLRKRFVLVRYFDSWPRIAPPGKSELWMLM